MIAERYELPKAEKIEEVVRRARLLITSGEGQDAQTFLAAAAVLFADRVIRYSKTSDPNTTQALAIATLAIACQRIDAES